MKDAISKHSEKVTCQLSGIKETVINFQNAVVRVTTDLCFFF